MLGCSFAAGLGYYVATQRDILSQLSHVDVLDLVLLAAVWSALYGLAGYRMKLLLETQGVQLRFSEWFGLPIVTTLCNYVLPQGGVAVQAAYLNRKRKVSLARFAATQIGQWLITFAVLGVIALWPSALIGASSYRYALLLGFGLLATVSALLLSILPSCVPFRGRSKVLADLHTGVSLLRAKRGALWQIVFLQALAGVLYGAWVLLGFRSIQIHVSYPDALLIGVILQISLRVSLTPGNIGIREALFGVIAYLLGRGFESGLSFAVVLRAVGIGMVLSLGLLFGTILLKSGTSTTSSTPDTRSEATSSGRSISSGVTTRDRTADGQ